MSWLAFLFEGALAVLIVVLIGYCVKLDRGLSAVRADEPQINALIARLVEVSERAEASVDHLKAAGIAQERALRAAIDEAEAVRRRLAAPGDRPRGPASKVVRPASGGEIDRSRSREGAMASSQSFAVHRAGQAAMAAAAQPSETSRPESRDEAEQVLIEAIRQARAAG